MRYLTILCIFFIITTKLSAQLNDNTWLLGRLSLVVSVSPQAPTCRLTFSNQVLQIDTVVQNSISCFDAFGSMSNDNGNLLFYTNGCSIHNNLYQPIINADSLCVCDSCIYANYGVLLTGVCSYETPLFISHPDSSHLYYLFHQTLRSPGYEYLTKNLYCTTLDASGNGGLASVKKKKQVLAETYGNQKLVWGQLTATKHANGKDWWLIQPLADTSGFVPFLIKGDTIIQKPTQYPSRAPIYSQPFQAIFSPNGLLYARAPQIRGLFYVELHDFNRCTGVLSNRRLIDMPSSFAGGSIAISPNNRFLYVAVSDWGQFGYSPYSWELYQYDLWANDVEASKEVVGVLDSTNRIQYYNNYTTLGSMQLAPDNKIYIGGGVGYLHTINNPDVKGVACNVQLHAITLNSDNYVQPTLPSFPNYRLGAMAESECWINEEAQEGDVISSSEELVSEQIKIYPNPAQDVLIVQNNLLFKEGTIVKIYNNLGQLMQTQSVNNSSNVVELNVSTFANGSYFVRISNGETTTSKLFIISK